MVPSDVSPPKHGPGRFRCLNRKRCSGLDDFKVTHKLAFTFLSSKESVDSYLAEFGHFFEER